MKSCILDLVPPDCRIISKHNISRQAEKSFLYLSWIISHRTFQNNEFKIPKSLPLRLVFFLILTFLHLHKRVMKKTLASKKLNPHQMHTSLFESLTEDTSKVCLNLSNFKRLIFDQLPGQIPQLLPSKHHYIPLVWALQKFLKRETLGVPVLWPPSPGVRSHHTFLRSQYLSWTF